jgi:hypothetical protein
LDGCFSSLTFPLIIRVVLLSRRLAVSSLNVINHRKKIRRISNLRKLLLDVRAARILCFEYYCSNSMLKNSLIRLCGLVFIEFLLNMETESIPVMAYLLLKKSLWNSTSNHVSGRFSVVCVNYLRAFEILHVSHCLKVMFHYS